MRAGFRYDAIATPKAPEGRRGGPTLVGRIRLAVAREGEGGAVEDFNLEPVS